MTAKEYLGQIYRINVHINILRRQKEDLRSQLYHGSGGMQIKERVQTSPDGDPYIKLIAKIDTLDRKIDRELAKLTGIKDKITGQIRGLDDPKYSELLFDRYVMLMKWEDIADSIGYDLRWTHRLHGRALEAFRNKYIDH